jgi:hypothetical protein
MKHIKLFESYSKKVTDRFKKASIEAEYRAQQAQKEISSVKRREMEAILKELDDDFSPVAEEDWLEDSDFRDTAMGIFLGGGVARPSQVEFFKLLKPTKEEIKKVITAVEEQVKNSQEILDRVEAGRLRANQLPITPEEFQKYITKTSQAILKELKGML